MRAGAAAWAAWASRRRALSLAWPLAAGVAGGAAPPLLAMELGRSEYE